MSTDAQKLGVIDQEIEKKSRELKELMLERQRVEGKEEPRTFLEIEVMAGEMGRQVSRAIISEVVAERTAAELANLEVMNCPACGKSCRRKVGDDGEPIVKEGKLGTPEGPVLIREPVFECSTCRRDFFPSTRRIAFEWS